MNIYGRNVISTLANLLRTVTDAMPQGNSSCLLLLSQPNQSTTGGFRSQQLQRGRVRLSGGCSAAAQW